MGLLDGKHALVFGVANDHLSPQVTGETIHVDGGSDIRGVPKVED